MRNPLIYILIVAAVVAFLIGERIDAAVVAAVVVVNGIIGFVLEVKASAVRGRVRHAGRRGVVFLRLDVRVGCPAQDSASDIEQPPALGNDPQEGGCLSRARRRAWTSAS